MQSQLLIKLEFSRKSFKNSLITWMISSHFRLLMGFISRQEAEDFLHKSQDGTFLIRFSDSELGGVTVAWITVNEAGHREVAMLQPFTRKDLMIRSLPDRLKDCPQVIYSYTFLDF